MFNLHRKCNKKLTVQRKWQHRVHKTTKNKTKTQQYVLDTTTHKLRKQDMSLAYKQLEVKTNRTPFSCGNRNGHHNTEFKT